MNEQITTVQNIGEDMVGVQVRRLPGNAEANAMNTITVNFYEFLEPAKVTLDYCTLLYLATKITHI